VALRVNSSVGDPMRGNGPGTLEEKVAAAREIVERLIAICRGFECEEWMAKFLAVREHLAAGRLREAIREEARLTSSVPRKWVVSRAIENRLERAMGVLHRQVWFPNHAEPLAQFDDLPSDVTALGTIEDENDRGLKAFIDSIQRDPLEEDPAYAEILMAAEEQAERELADHPMNGGIGFCHVFWDTKRMILKQKFGLDWRTPAELNPSIIFD
jgi:hypothetical protein